MKMYIPIGEYFFGGWIEQFISFLSNGVTNVDIGNGIIHYSLFIHIHTYSLFHVEIRRNPVISVPTRSSRRVE